MNDKVGRESFFWENPTWVFSESENYAGTDDKRGKNPIFQSSNTSTPTLVPNSTPTPIPSTPVGQNRGPIGATKSGGTINSGDWTGCKGGAESDHEVHIWTERERRKKMKNMFANLHALVPHLPPKADKATIVDEAVVYIKTLQQTLQKLQKQKLERIGGKTLMNYDSSLATQTNPTFRSRELYMADQIYSMNHRMVTSMSQSLSGPNFPVSFQTWSSANFVLNVCGEDAQISICTPKKLGLLSTILCVLEKHKVEVVTVQVSSDCNKSLFMIHTHVDQFQVAMSVEEIFKLAVTEMIFWISS